MVLVFLCILLLIVCRIAYMFFFFFFKQKTAYEMRISDWSSDVCSSDLHACVRGFGAGCRASAFVRSCGNWHTSTGRSEEHTSELQSLMRNSYAVYCLNKKKNTI